MKHPPQWVFSTSSYQIELFLITINKSNKIFIYFNIFLVVFISRNEFNVELFLDQ
jgi:hypothetical protein